MQLNEDDSLKIKNSLSKFNLNKINDSMNLNELR